jgi:hypothetical protein
MVVAVVFLTLLHGTVRIGPTTPVCRAGLPCDRLAVHIRLTFTHGATRQYATTNRFGRYSVRLSPGAWTVASSVGMRITPATFVVPRTSSTRRDFAIDTGIR